MSIVKPTEQDANHNFVTLEPSKDAPYPGESSTQR